jgi:hypothetical protein
MANWPSRRGYSDTTVWVVAGVDVADDGGEWRLVAEGHWGEGSGKGVRNDGFGGAAGWVAASRVWSIGARLGGVRGLARVSSPWTGHRPPTSAGVRARPRR